MQDSLPCPLKKKDKCTYYMSTEIYSKQSCQIKMVCKNNLIGHMIFLTSEKYRMGPVIGHTIFFTSEKNCIGFPAFRRGFPKWECFTTFAASPESIMVSRFVDIVSVEQFIEDQENENTKK